MLPWRRGGKNPGWLAIVPNRDRIDVAHVVRGAVGRPEIRRCDSFGRKSEAETILFQLGQSLKLQGYRCVTLLPESDYRLIQTPAPTVPAEERLQAVRWQLKDMVDFPVHNAAVQVLDVPQDSSSSGRQPAIFAVAAPEPAISICMSSFREAKVPLVAIDIPELAQRNVAALFEQENRGLAFLTLLGSETLLTITYRGELYFARRFDLSASRLAEADSERRQQLLERMVLELQRTLDNFDRQYSFISVTGLRVMCEAGIDDLIPYLADSFYLPVQPVDLADVVDFSAVPELKAPERQAQCLLAIGAALREAV